MIKHLLTAALLGAMPLALSAASNLNVLPWVDGGYEWNSTTTVEKIADKTYKVYITAGESGGGIDFQNSGRAVDFSNYTGVKIDITNNSGGWKNVYINYSDGSYSGFENQGATGIYPFESGKEPVKIVFKYQNATTETLTAFTLLAPYETVSTCVSSEEMRMNDSWGAYFNIPASQFQNLKAGDRITINYNGWGGSNSWDQQGQIYAPKKAADCDPNKESDACNLFYTHNGDGKIWTDLSYGTNTLSKELTEQEISYLKLYGLSFCGHHFTVTSVYVETVTSDNPTEDVPEAAEPSVDPVQPNEGLGGTPIGVAPKASLPNLFDNDGNTIYSSTRRDHGWAGLDLGTPYVINKVKWMAADDDAKNTLLGVFEGANSEDFSDAIPFYIIRRTNGKGQWNEAEVICSRGFRYVRYVGPRPLDPQSDKKGNGDDSQCYGVNSRMAELRFFGTPGAGDDSNLWRFSNLPMVILNTVNMEEPWDHYADPEKDHDLTARLISIGSDGKIVDKPGITRERGNHSRFFPKRPLRMKYDKKATPISSAKANKKKWELLNNYGDKTLMRNLLAFDIARMLGMSYVPFCTPVDVFLNGEYRGCYQLADSKEIDKSRVNIAELDDETDWNAGTNITGGYFVEIDAYAYQEPAGTWFNTSNGYGIPITVKSPKPEDDLSGIQAHLPYITNYFNDLTGRVSAGKFDGKGSYHEIFDVESFLQLLMTNEVGGNKDVMWSFNMYKDRNDPLIYSGPAWDFDVAFNNSRWLPAQAFDNYNGKNFLYQITWSVADADQSAVQNNKGTAFRDFTDKVLSDPKAWKELEHLWAAARDNGLSAEYLCDQADYYKGLMGESVDLNFERWPIMGSHIHDADWGYPNYDKALDHVKDFCRKIVSHFDNVLKYSSYKDSHKNELYVVVTGKNATDQTLTFACHSDEYGKLWIKDESTASAPAAAPARASAVDKDGFKMVGKNFAITKVDLTEPHIYSAYVAHAGRKSDVVTFTVTPDGNVLAVDSVVDSSVEYPKEYFTLTGIRVAAENLTPGIYICRQGKNATKVLVR